MSYARRPIQILDQNFKYEFRDIPLTAVKLLLECGHATVRKTIRDRYVCVKCWKENKAKESHVKFDAVGQGIFSF